MSINEQINIFIVDDNKIFLLALKAVIETDFQNKPIKMHLFETGESCLEKLKTITPELIVLDYHLNSKSRLVTDGLAFLTTIKAKSPETNVIMLTSNDDIDIALKSFRYGASDYVIKNDKQFQNIKNSISKIFDKKELVIKNEKISSDKELAFQNEEKQKRADELMDLTTQKIRAERINTVIEEKNKNITDSINYAKRIQLAKLPRKEAIYASLPQSFVLYKPKDIVSGDFYFFYKNEQFVFIVAADCTGHGVPGAFMSMIGSEKLEEAVANSSDTSEILKYLNRAIKSTLHQSDNNDSTRDGMDIALCRIDLQNGIVRYAGANRPIWIIRNGSLLVDEIKGTKKAIGGLTDHEQHFDSHEFELKKGDTFYIASDGYADQFGGSKGKKLMTKQFKETLLDIQHKSMPDQEEHLDSYLENWKVGREQVDDVLVIGVRL